MDFTINENKDFNSLEISFDGKPIIKKEEKNDIQFKAFTLINDEKTAIDVISAHYDNGCYRGWFYNKDDKMNKHITQDFKNHLILKTFDNMLIDIELEKPSIKNTLYYDDETEGPELTEENFILYNLKYLNFYYLKSSLYFAKHYNKYNNNAEYIKLINGRYLCDYKPEDVVRIITDEEEKDLVALYNYYQNEFIKRLKNYWKKYNKKIYTEGYWANR